MRTLLLLALTSLLMSACCIPGDVPYVPFITDPRAGLAEMTVLQAPSITAPERR